AIFSSGPPGPDAKPAVGNLRPAGRRPQVRPLLAAARAAWAAWFARAARAARAARPAGRLGGRVAGPAAWGRRTAARGGRRALGCAARTAGSGLFAVAAGKGKCQRSGDDHQYFHGSSLERDNPYPANIGPPCARSTI